MSSKGSKGQDPIFALRQAFFSAIMAGDINKLAELVADDVVIMPPNDTTIYGKEEWRSWWEDYYQYFRVAASSESEREVAVNGDYAIERSDYMAAVAPVSGGSRIRDDGRFFAIWKRQSDGSWKIWRMMWNSIKPIGIGTNRYMSRMMQKKAGVKR
jgi:ketosteroid isomerase-like protein